MSETKISKRRNNTGISAYSENVKHAVDMQLKIRALNRGLKHPNRHKDENPADKLSNKRNAFRTQICLFRANS